jgi:hypothetical protein
MADKWSPLAGTTSGLLLGRPLGTTDAENKAKFYKQLYF